MLSHENNTILTRTGPGTAMGNFMRCFWIPAMTEAELPAPDEPGVRLTLLNEALLVFRDSEGQIGVIEEHCPHRRASFYFGRNEEGGIRCVYHGWKFDRHGNCLDMPSEPPDSPMKARIKARTYPVRVAGGVLWVYLGQPERMPPLPHFEWFDVPAEQCYLSRWEQDCNYAQAMEGELDSAHVGFLHRLVNDLDTDARALTGSYFQQDTAPLWKIIETPGGFMACNGRKVEDDQRYWRLNQFLLPFFTMIPPRPVDARVVRMWVPMTDERCWVICVTYRPDQPLTEAELTAWRRGENSHREVIPGTTRPTQRRDNEYLIDRALQKTRSFTGILGIRAQDAMVTESAGAIVDRTQENLGTSDRAVVAMRRTLLNGAMALRDQGKPPVAPQSPHLYSVRATQAVLPENINPTQAPELMNTAQPPHPSPT